MNKEQKSKALHEFIELKKKFDKSINEIKKQNLIINYKHKKNDY